jgi:uncharacterized protein YcbK (DUF882 family)
LHKTSPGGEGGADRILSLGGPDSSMGYFSNDELFPVWREPRSIWERTGLTTRQQRVLDVVLLGLLVLFAGGWIYVATISIQRGESPFVARQIGISPSPLSPDAPPNATFLTSLALEQFIDWEGVRGASGEVYVIFQEPGDTLAMPDAVPEEVAVTYLPAEGERPDTAIGIAETGGQPPGRAGIWNIALRMRSVVREVPSLSVVTLMPAAEARSGRIGQYRIGEWPRGEGAYAPPRGFVEVTPENMDMYVSKHFQLKDFLTKGQEGVWPKYVVLDPRLLDKLELTIQELEAMGHPVENVFVISGFRTPWYNAHGGTTAGRGAMSRHMYGDAADIAIDNTRNNCMDDLNGDGRVDIQDARIIVEAAERVERKYPHLVGGIGIYRPQPGSHCGMVHIDTRGNRARW